MDSSRFPSFLLPALLPLSLAACSGDDTNPVGPPAPDASTPGHDAGMDASPLDGSMTGNLDATTDTGTEAATADASDAALPYPATALPLPRVRNVGGSVLATARIVPVLFASDDPTFKTEILDFLGKFATDGYMKSAAGDYGVLGATVASPVIVTDPAPATIDDSVIQTWIAGYLNDIGVDAGGEDAGTTPWPAADGNSIYAVFYPAGTTVTLSGQPGSPPSVSCTGFGAYHSEDALATGSTPYAVIPRCNGYLGHSGIDFVTGAASHELLEAATDPFVNSAPANDDTDFNGSGWDLTVGGPEIGDLCKLEDNAFFTPTSLGYLVQRTWSNVQAAGGHEPCLPELTGAPPYFTAFPDLEGIEAYPGYYVSGVNVQPAASRTIDIHLTSDAATSGPWTVAAVEEGSPQAPPDPDNLLSFAWDRTTGQNGDVLHLTITRKATPSTTITHGLPLTITSTLGSQTNSFWTIVGE